MKVTYDKDADAAYVYLDPLEPFSSFMYPFDGVKKDAMVNLDFDQNGRLIGVEVIDARRLLASELLDQDTDIGRVVYDPEADAAYISLVTHTLPRGASSAISTYPCDPAEVGAIINLNFDTEGRLIGIEALDARRKLPEVLLKTAIHPGVQPSAAPRG